MALASITLCLAISSLKISTTEPLAHLCPNEIRDSFSCNAYDVALVSILCWNKAIRVSFHNSRPISKGELALIANTGAAMV